MTDGRMLDGIRCTVPVRGPRCNTAIATGRSRSTTLRRRSGSQAVARMARLVVLVMVPSLLMFEVGGDGTGPVASYQSAGCASAAPLSSGPTTGASDDGDCATPAHNPNAASGLFDSGPPRLQLRLLRSRPSDGMDRPGDQLQLLRRESDARAVPAPPTSRQKSPRHGFGTIAGAANNYGPLPGVAQNSSGVSNSGVGPGGEGAGAANNYSGIVGVTQNAGGSKSYGPLPGALNSSALSCTYCSCD